MPKQGSASNGCEATGGPEYPPVPDAVSVVAWLALDLVDELLQPDDSVDIPSDLRRHAHEGVRQCVLARDDHHQLWRHHDLGARQAQPRKHIARYVDYPRC